MNTLGYILRLTTFGESHGPAMGGILDGFPPGLKFDFDALRRNMDRRRPGTSPLTSARREADIPEILSGLSEDGITLGTPIGFIIRNTDCRSEDYSPDALRPNHADYTYNLRYGIRDFRGGGRSSARETVNWVVGGEFARQLLALKGISVSARLVSAGGNSDSPEDEIARAKASGDSVGAIIEGEITGMQGGVGNPVFSKLHAMLAHAMMSINAAKGFEYGLGFDAAAAHGSTSADLFTPGNGSPHIETNYSGGIQGGISNGLPITFRVAFKPTPTIFKELPTTDSKGNPTTLHPRGRHDPCVGVRAIVIVEALTALVVADSMLSQGIRFTELQNGSLLH